MLWALYGVLRLYIFLNGTAATAWHMGSGGVMKGGGEMLNIEEIHRSGVFNIFFYIILAQLL